MELIPEIDEKKTAVKAKRFLNKEFPKLVLLAGLSDADIKSPTISDMPSSSPVGNANEEAMIKKFERQDEVKNVIKAINSTSRFKRKILWDVYINKIADWKIAQSIGYGSTRYKELKNQAAIDFACAMEAYGVDLIIYKKATF